MNQNLFWGKFDPRNSAFLPLAAHCLDVAVVFRQLTALPAVRCCLECAGGAMTEAQLDRLAVLAAFHDVGKANLGFQGKALDPRVQASHIRELEVLFDDEELNDRFAQALNVKKLYGWFADDGLEKLLLAAWSHHGKPVQFQGERSGNYFLAKRWWQPQGDRDPMAAVGEILAWTQAAFPRAFAPAPPMAVSPRLQHLFAGLVMLADWLGSHPDWFPIQETTLQERLNHDRCQAPQLLQAVGLDISRVKLPDLDDFAARFGFSPRSVQALVDCLNPEDSGTRLVILEAETGSGKTEAALNWFFKLFAAGQVAGLYFALPTRVAARELYQRVVQTIVRWFPNPAVRPVTVLAVPEYPQVDGLPRKAFLPDPERANLWQEDQDVRWRERTWAAEHPKRFLATTVAVGTIDQALLSVVQTSHAHLRSACLAQHLLVVDEVHASDTYMGRLLERLLHHHLDLGGYALFLSATLGSAAKSRYLKVAQGQWTAPDFEQAQTVAYPAVTVADGRILCAAASSSGLEKRITFELQPCAFQPEQMADRLRQALSGRAKVLVILNTVSRANALLRALEGCLDREWFFCVHGVICPHHGRFAPADRVVLDEAVSGRFGKESAPGPVLLIGTQTLEQSLDLDADFLISDLAPMDVLLQRLGRLHRHRRDRPQGFEAPHCVVLVPEGELESGLDGNGKSISTYAGIGWGSVYSDLRVLELTRRLLVEHPEIAVPRDNRFLVESVTHPERLAMLSSERWQKHTQEIEGEELMKAIIAGQAMIDFDKSFGEFSFTEMGGKVVTRLGTDSLELPVEPAFISPFGQKVDRIVIPGHMKPRQSREEVVQVVAQNQELEVILRCGDKRYRYNRFGLEEML